MVNTFGVQARSSALLNRPIAQSNDSADIISWSLEPTTAERLLASKGLLQRLGHDENESAPNGTGMSLPDSPDGDGSVLVAGFSIDIPDPLGIGKFAEEFVRDPAGTLSLVFGGAVGGLHTIYDMVVGLGQIGQTALAGLLEIVNVWAVARQMPFTDDPKLVSEWAHNHSAEVSEAAQELVAYLVVHGDEVPGQVADALIAEIREIQRLYEMGDPKSKFEAGERFGHLISSIFSAVEGGVSMARSGVRMTRAFSQSMSNSVKATTTVTRMMATFRNISPDEIPQALGFVDKLARNPTTFREVPTTLKLSLREGLSQYASQPRVQKALGILDDLDGLSGTRPVHISRQIQGGAQTLGRNATLAQRTGGAAVAGPLAPIPVTVNPGVQLAADFVNGIANPLVRQSVAQQANQILQSGGDIDKPTLNQLQARTETQLATNTRQVLAGQVFLDPQLQATLRTRLSNEFGNDVSNNAALPHSPQTVMRLANDIVLDELSTNLFRGSGVSDADVTAYRQLALDWARGEDPTNPAIRIEQLIQQPGWQTILLRELAIDRLSGFSHSAAQSLGDANASTMAALRLNIARQIDNGYESASGLKNLLSQPGSSARTKLIRDAVVQTLGGDSPLQTLMAMRAINAGKGERALVNLVTSPQARVRFMVESLVNETRRADGGRLPAAERSQLEQGINEALAERSGITAKEQYLKDLSNSPQLLGTLSSPTVSSSNSANPPSSNGAGTNNITPSENLPTPANTGDGNLNNIPPDQPPSGNGPPDDGLSGVPPSQPPPSTAEMGLTMGQSVFGRLPESNQPVIPFPLGASAPPSSSITSPRTIGADPISGKPIRINTDGNLELVESETPTNITARQQRPEEITRLPRDLARVGFQRIGQQTSAKLGDYGVTVDVWRQQRDPAQPFDIPMPVAALPQSLGAGGIVQRVTQRAYALANRVPPGTGWSVSVSGPAASVGSDITSVNLGNSITISDMESAINSGAVLFDPAAPPGQQYRLNTVLNAEGQAVPVVPVPINIGWTTAVSPTKITGFPSIPFLGTNLARTSSINTNLDSAINPELLQAINRGLNNPIGFTIRSDANSPDILFSQKISFALPGIPPRESAYNLPLGWGRLDTQLIPAADRTIGKWSATTTGVVGLGASIPGAASGSAAITTTRIENAPVDFGPAIASTYDIPPTAGGMAPHAAVTPFQFVAGTQGAFGEYRLIEILPNADSSTRFQGQYVEPDVQGTLTLLPRYNIPMPGSVLNALNGHSVNADDLPRIASFLRKLDNANVGIDSGAADIYSITHTAKLGEPLSAENVRTIREAIRRAAIGASP